MSQGQITVHGMLDIRNCKHGPRADLRPPHQFPPHVPEELEPANHVQRLIDNVGQPVESGKKDLKKIHTMKHEVVARLSVFN